MAICTLEFAYDVAAARATARLLVAGLNRGRTMTLADAQIAGSCSSIGAALATRNVKDFRHLDGLEIIDPFQHA